jgi:excisionase family DNA binding protein
MDSLLYTVDEASRLTQLSRATLYRRIADGQLVSIRVGRARRISAQALEHFITVMERESRRQIADRP